VFFSLFRLVDAGGRKKKKKIKKSSPIISTFPMKTRAFELQ
jgi:hypothetical protein